jgi:hypothetical protein
MIKTQRAARKQNLNQKAADTSIKIIAPVEPAPVKRQAVGGRLKQSVSDLAPATSGGTTVFTLPGIRP